MELTLERKNQSDGTVIFGAGVMMTPAIDEDYWQYRVVLTAKQSIVGFPKFGTIGIGFAVEEDWNTNLPYTCETQKIWNHIKGNKGVKIPDSDCIAAIAMIQEAVRSDKGE